MTTRKKALLALTMMMLVLATDVCGQKKTTQRREKFEFSFELPVYVEQLKQELTFPLSWEHSGIKRFSKWQKVARRKVRECMLTPPRRADSFDMQVLAEEQRDGYRALKVAFNQNAYTRLTAYVLVPDGEGPFPAVNLLHDHGAHLFIGKEKMIRPFDVTEEVLNDADAWAENLYGGQYVGDFLARHGYVCFSADAPMWGERCREEGIDRSKYDIIAGNMMMLGRSLCGFMHYDDITATDFMATLPWVDAQRIGCMGCSMGAYRAWMLAALSDRIKAGAAVCWLTTTDVQMSTADGKRENGGFANCLPGLRQWLDYPDVASLAAPRAMLFINGRQDRLFPVRGVEQAFAQMRRTWQRLGADDMLETQLWDVPHSCGVEIQTAVLNFFDRRLKARGR